MNKRYWHMMNLFFIKSPMKRAQYLKKHEVFKHIGDKIMITSRKIPLYSRLISIGDNVWIASGVEFITHDVTHFMLNNIDNRKEKFSEKVGCIEVGNNVFIGTGTKILYDVKIGDNVIIAAGSIVTKDIPSNSVIGGVPAKKICSFEDYIEKRRSYKRYYPPNNKQQEISEKCEKENWDRFFEER